MDDLKQSVKSSVGWLELAAYTSNPTDTDSARKGLAVINGVLKLWTGSAWSTVTGGGSSTPTWEDVALIDSTFTINSAPWTIAGNDADANDVVVFTNIAGSSGDVIQITNSGTGNDIQGTSNTWKVTKAGVATFAGVSISGTASALATTGAAVWTLLDNSSTSLSIGASGATTMLLFDTTNGSEVVSTAATRFQVTDGQLTLISTSNAAPMLLGQNDTITTFGNGTTEDEGMVVFSSDTLSTGDLIRLQLDESALSGGAFLKMVQTDAGAAVFTVGENGVTTIAGAGGATAFTITAGDVVWSDASLAITDADNAASFTVTNNTATTASVIVVAGSGVFTGNTTSSFMTVTASGLTTGTAMYVPLAGLTTGKGVSIVSSSVGLTSGNLLNLDHTSSGTLAARTGALAALTTSMTHTADTDITQNFNTITISRTAVRNTGGADTHTTLAQGALISLALTTTATTGTITDTTNGISITLPTANGGSGVAVTQSGAAGNGLSVTANAMTTGLGLSIASSATAITGAGRMVFVNHTGTTGTSATLNEFKTAATDETVLMKLTATAALALGTVLQASGASVTTGAGITANDFNALTTGIVLHLASSATAITGAGRLLYSNHTGATGTSAILNEFASAANDETVILKVTSSAALALGTALAVSGASITTGNAITANDLNALTTGIGLHLASSATAITGAGRLLYSNHTGATGTSAILNEFASAANDETVILKVTGSAALAAGMAFQVSVAAMTTGNAIAITNADALTTGKMLSLVSNSADATARTLAFVHNDNVAATGVTVLSLRQDAPTSTNFYKIMNFTNGTATCTLWLGNGTNSPNTALTGTAGDILFNGDSGKAYYCTGTTNWTALA